MKPDQTHTGTTGTAATVTASDIQGKNSGRKEILKVKPVNGKKKAEKAILEHKGQAIDCTFLVLILQEE